MGEDTIEPCDVKIDDQPPMSDRELEIANLGRDFPQYTFDANFCVFIKLVHNRQEVTDDIKKETFYPDYVHQFFTNNERIFGYKNPIIRIFYTASRLKRYVKFDYEDRLNSDKDGIDADNVMQDLAPVLDEIEYTQDLNQFITEVESKDETEFRPPGDLLLECNRPYKQPKHLSRAQLEQALASSLSNGDVNSNGDTPADQRPTNGESSEHNGISRPKMYESCDTTTLSKKKFQIYHANRQTKNFDQFQSRMQSLVMWFIESATMIDYEDPQWDFFMIFERYNPSTADDANGTPVSVEDRYYLVGYATVYRYYAYPDRTRPRVSQMLLLPPYRRNGLGTILLQTIYDYYMKQPATLDMTAEDPDDEFIAMRDFLDCKNCSELPEFQPEMLKQGWSESMATAAQSKLKLCHRQSRKVYEVLRLGCVNRSDDEEYRKYRLDIKNRLNIPNRRLMLDCDKVEKKGYPLPDEMKMQREKQKVVYLSLDSDYRELERQYMHTIDKLKHQINV